MDNLLHYIMHVLPKDSLDIFVAGKNNPWYFESSVTKQQTATYVRTAAKVHNL
jgi:hypothetical protein